LTFFLFTGSKEVERSRHQPVQQGAKIDPTSQTCLLCPFLLLLFSYGTTYLKNPLLATKIIEHQRALERKMF
jgi:hypothetical protein